MTHLVQKRNKQGDVININNKNTSYQKVNISVPIMSCKASCQIDSRFTIISSSQIGEPEYCACQYIDTKIFSDDYLNKPYILGIE